MKITAERPEVLKKRTQLDRQGQKNIPQWLRTLQPKNNSIPSSTVATVCTDPFCYHPKLFLSRNSV